MFLQFIIQYENNFLLSAYNLSEHDFMTHPFSVTHTKIHKNV